MKKFFLILPLFTFSQISLAQDFLIQRITADTSKSWQLIIPVKKGACLDCPNYYGLRDPETEAVLNTSYPAGYEVYAKREEDAFGSFYRVYIRDTNIESRDTLELSETSKPTFHYCQSCQMAFIFNDAKKISGRIRFSTNRSDAEGHKYTRTTEDGEITETFQLVRRSN